MTHSETAGVARSDTRNRRRSQGWRLGRRPRLLAAITLVATCAWVAAAAANDWPQWQGPDRNSTSQETGLLQAWPPEGPPLAWRVDGLGWGFSTPSVAAGRIFGMSHRGEDEVVWAISEADGRPLWTTRLGQTLDQEMPQPEPEPAPVVEAAPAQPTAQVEMPQMQQPAAQVAPRVPSPIGPASNTSTPQPAFASRHAMASPLTPPPMMITD